MHHEPAVRRWLRRVTAGATTAGLLAVVVPSAGTQTAGEPDEVAPPAEAPVVELVSHRERHPNRRIKRHRVRPGDTPSGLAVRYHAWTAELIRMNHGSTLYVGEVVRIPVVVRASRACTRHRHHRTNLAPRPAKPDRPASKAAPKPRKPNKAKASRPAKKPNAHRRPHIVRHAHGWHHRDASRAQVRHAIAKRARWYGVNPDLALAVAWQESGWQHDQVSSAGALGAMQVMPATGRWMSLVVGRRLNLRDLRDNAVAGVALLRLLREQAGPRYAIAGYYQGLAGVRRHGMYPSTKRYVANVVALRRLLAHGWNPA